MKSKKSFDIYTNSRGEYQAVKQGFAWPAFFFAFFWLFFHKLWAIGIGFLLLDVALGYAAYVYSTTYEVEGLVRLTEIAIRIILGWCGNNWRRKHLLARGYVLKSAIQAPDPDTAIWAILPEEKKHQLKESPHHAYQAARNRYSLIVAAVLGCGVIVMHIVMAIVYFEDTDVFTSRLPEALLISIFPALIVFALTWGSVYAVFYPLMHRLFSK